MTRVSQPFVRLPKSAEPDFHGPDGADRLAHFLFHELESGFYVDVAPGGRYLNSRVFDSLGWEGICIEARTVGKSRLNDVLDQEAPGRVDIDFLSLDVRGREARVLDSFAFKRHNVRVLYVATSTDEVRQAVLDEMSERGGWPPPRILEGGLFYCRSRDDAAAVRWRRVGDEEVSQSNLVYQELDESLWSVIRGAPRTEPGVVPPIVHAVNVWSTSQELEVTAETMRVAAAQVPGTRLVGIQEAADDDAVPDGFERGRDLDRTVLDLGVDAPRAYPLLFDVLDRAVEVCTPDDLVIFSNADICVRPWFYRVVGELASLGFDAIIVNRRRIGREDEYPAGSALYQAELGSTHPGWDCFAFTPDLYRLFERNDACVGVSGVAQGLLSNLLARAEKLLILTETALTYHYGDDRVWRGAGWAVAGEHNEREYLSTLRRLCEDEVARRRLVEFAGTRSGLLLPAREFLRSLTAG